jgi:hypothetical protein
MLDRLLSAWVLGLVGGCQVSDPETKRAPQVGFDLGAQF